MEKESKEKKVIKMSLASAVLIVILLLTLLAAIALLGFSVLKPRLEKENNINKESIMSNENINNIVKENQTESKDAEHVQTFSYTNLKTTDGIILEYPNDKKWNWNKDENGQYTLTVERNRRKGSYYI